MRRFEDIETFVAIARAGSISGAARQLGVAKSAVSRRLSELEARLGVSLIHRTTRALTLTDTGTAYLARTERILDDLEDAEARARASLDELSGRLRVSLPLGYGKAVLQPMLTAFIREHPSIEMMVHFSDQRIDFVEGGYDVGVRISSMQDSTLISRKIKDVDRLVVATPVFWDCYGRPKKPEDLSALDCLRYTNQARPEMIQYFGPGGEKGSIPAKLKLMANDGAFLIEEALDHQGYIIKPDFLIDGHIKAGRLEPVLIDYIWSELVLHLVFPPTRRMSANARAFADALLAFHKHP